MVEYERLLDGVNVATLLLYDTVPLTPLLVGVKVLLCVGWVKRSEPIFIIPLSLGALRFPTYNLHNAAAAAAAEGKRAGGDC